ncbi:hypothetical protein BUALT_Bualt09G0115400 [Buddleja alternifolia]|uniref:non-specific serine/threonine protein kinase n=1 Tax=Buddleja alternifolia TaxID=168488 RepID=A0AAV6X172_9LAMI|nr:hypothetical protein BUALT_Bualt09G0115400 [Buddleja alternifolia]
MFSLANLVPLFLLPLIAFASSDPSSFTFNGFNSANLSLDGLAQITPNGLLRLSNNTKQQSGHAFFPSPFTFQNSSNNSTFSFSTYFVFAIVPQFQPLGGHGMAFVIAPTRGLPGSLPSTYLGLFNGSNNGNASNHIVAIELDTLKSSEFNDINDNHVGIDINGLDSELARPVAYYDSQTGLFQNLTLNSGQPMQVWIEYDGVSELLNVTLAPLHSGKPRIPLLSLRYNLSPIIDQIMYVGFSSAPLLTSHYVLGWSFKINGVAQPLDLSRLPKLPRVGPKKPSKFLIIGLPVISIASLLLSIFTVAYYIRRKWKYAEVLERWEIDYIPQRFIYKDLYTATKGFKDKELLGTGGFGKVYRAPEHTRTGKATTRTDVYAFGAFLLEVACGRRPVEPKGECETAVLVEWVFSMWSKGEILGAVDPNLGSDYAEEEVELVLQLGLLCSHSRPDIRPSMREIGLYLEGSMAMPELSSLGVATNGLAFGHNGGFDDFRVSYPSSETMFTGSVSVSNSLISGGR